MPSNGPNAYIRTFDVSAPIFFYLYQGDMDFVYKAIN
jgi:hypothetical protein